MGRSSTDTTHFFSPMVQFIKSRAWARPDCVSPDEGVRSSEADVCEIIRTPGRFTPMPFNPMLCSKDFFLSFEEFFCLITLLTLGSGWGFLCCAFLHRTDYLNSLFKTAVKNGGRAEMAVFASTTVFHSLAAKISTMFPPDGFRKSSSSPGWKYWYLKCWSVWVGKVLLAAYFANENWEKGFSSLRLELKQTNQRNKKWCNGVITKLFSFQYKLS